MSAPLLSVRGLAVTFATSFGPVRGLDGADFDVARQYARTLAEERGLDFAPSFAPDLVRGVATYALELFRAAPSLDALYVPVGLGSGICG
jgi:threonine dehydratase